ncbi:MAG: GNAT family N-acetyltransferase [Hyphomicrobiales bacterium]
MTIPTPTSIPQRADDPLEIDYSDPGADDFEALARDRVPVRSMTPDDLSALIAIDRRITGHERSAYYERKLAETMDESAVRVSLVAELDGRPVGFIMARVDFGEFGHTEPEAVIDTIGVNPDYAHQEIGKAMMSQLLTNLRSLHVEGVRTEVEWNDFGLLGFLEQCGFVPAQRIAFRLSL